MVENPANAARGQQIEQPEHRGGFAGPVGTEEGGDATRRQRHGEIPYYDRAAAGHLETNGLEDGHDRECTAICRETLIYITIAL